MSEIVHDMNDYWEIMNEPLPNSKDFGYDVTAQDGNAEYERFMASAGYCRWQIAMAEWSIRRQEAERERYGGGESEYAKYVMRSTASAIAYEQGLVDKWKQELTERSAA